MFWRSGGAGGFSRLSCGPRTAGKGEPNHISMWCRREGKTELSLNLPHLPYQIVFGEITRFTFRTRWWLSWLSLRLLRRGSCNDARDLEGEVGWVDWCFLGISLHDKQHWSISVLKWLYLVPIENIYKHLNHYILTNHGLTMTNITMSRQCLV